MELAFLPGPLEFSLRHSILERTKQPSQKVGSDDIEAFGAEHPAPNLWCDPTRGLSSGPLSGVPMGNRTSGAPDLG